MAFLKKNRCGTKAQAAALNAMRPVLGLTVNTAIKIVGVVGAAVGAVLLASKAASDSDTDTDNTEPERDGEDSTPKYKLRVTYPDGSVFDEDETFDSVDAANDYGEYVLACCREGAEILNMSNPGDYPLDDYMDPDYEVVKVE